MKDQTIKVKCCNPACGKPFHFQQQAGGPAASEFDVAIHCPFCSGTNMVRLKVLARDGGIQRSLFSVLDVHYMKSKLPS